MHDAAFRLLTVPPDDLGAEHRYVHVIGATVFVDDRIGEARWHAHFVGVVDGHAWWAVDVPPDDDPSFGTAIDLRRFHGMAPEHHWLAAGRAVQIVEWARTHRFCGRCGEPTHPLAGERAMRCPTCSLIAFPRISPAMITLVTRGEPGPDQEVLLARGAEWATPTYSCLAGFVEPGESLEDAVVREVREEVAIVVTEPTYVGSQPWPFPNSLMIGFRAAYLAGDIVCDPAEIADANWYHRRDLPLLPAGISIARKLIDAWIGEVPPAR
jgi:NAD+ diphosphatase